MGGDGGCRVGEVRADTTSPMPDHKGFKLQLMSRDPPAPFLSELSEIYHFDFKGKSPTAYTFVLSVPLPFELNTQ